MNSDREATGQRPVWGVMIVFLGNGALFGNWVSRIPAIQSELNLTEGQLGLVLVGLSVGVLTALSFAGGLIARMGSRVITLGGMMALCLALPLIPLAPQPGLLWFALFIFGGALSTMDVAMNAQAIDVERLAQRPLMSTFHGAFSAGGLIGALMGSGMAKLAVSPLNHFFLAAILFGVVTLFAGQHLVIPVEKEILESERETVFQLPPRTLWPLGAVALISSFAEGAMADWSAVYLTEVLHATTAMAALGFAAYSLTMTVGRLTGDRLQAHWHPTKTVSVGGLLAAAGLLMMVTLLHPRATLIGLALVGLGLANIIPLAFRAAGNFPNLTPGTGIAGVATIGYAGFLAGPPLVGFVAEATSLQVAFLMIGTSLVSLLWLAAALSPATGDPKD